MILTVFATCFPWVLSSIIEFNNAFTSTLAILAALDSNLVANLGLRKYSPSFICTSVEQNGEFWNLNPVQNFLSVIRSDPNLVDLSKYLIQSGLYPKKL